MDKILDQAQIDALVRAAQKGTGEGKDEHKPRVTPCDFHEAGLITKDQSRSVNVLHDTFARNLSHSLGAYLRVSFEVNVVSVEQLSYAEFLQRVPEITYLASVHIRPLDAMAAVEIDLSLAFPVIDLLLGGQGKPIEEKREITEIEEQILDSVVKIILRELQNAWEPVLSVEFVFDQRQAQTQIVRLMPPNEKVLSLSFEIRMPNVRGALNWAFPAVVSNALLRKLSQEWSYRKQRTDTSGLESLRERVKDCSFPTELSLPATSVPVRDLVDLQVGQIIALRNRLSDPGFLTVSGKKLFAAYPVRSGNMRAGQIQEHLQISEEKRKEIA